MKITYRVTENDYVGAMRLHYRPTTKHKIIYAVIALILFSGIIFGNGFILPIATGLAIGISIGMIVALIRFSYVVRKGYRKYPAMQGVFTIEPSVDGFAMTSENSSQTLIWDNIVKWRENDKFILIYIIPALFYPL